MTRLRKMMLEELQRRNYAEGATHSYVRAVQQFARYFGKSPDKLRQVYIQSVDLLDSQISEYESGAIGCPTDPRTP